MNCNIFMSYYHSYSITRDGKVYSKYTRKELSKKVKDGFNEVLFSFGTGKQRVTQWFRVDFLVANKYLPNLEEYTFIRHKDGDNLNDNVENLEWCKYCTSEESAEIPGYYGKYIITKSGRIYNNMTGVEMKTRLLNGYEHIALRWFDGEKSEQKLYKVHRLVAEAFLERKADKPFINHKDGNKTNNNLGNLEWVDNQENCIHAVQTGLRHLNWNRKTAEAAIRLIEEYNMSASEVGAIFGVPKSSVLYLYRRGYKNLGVKVSENKLLKSSKYEETKPVPIEFIQYIRSLIKERELKENTVLSIGDNTSI